jgi:hypothetical protein
MQSNPLSASSTTLGQVQLPIMPTLPEMNMMDDEAEDAAEEKKLMSILLRLKTAQSSMDENRQRSGLSV